MKEEGIPQIPQQSQVQAHSMHSTIPSSSSQKWFSSTHRRIFTQGVQSHPPGALLALMREQIAIGMQLQAQKVEAVIKEQASSLVGLRDRLNRNQKELSDKNRIIGELGKIIALKNKQQLSIVHKMQEQQKNILDLQESQQKALCELSRIKQVFRQYFANIATHYANKLRRTTADFEERLQQVQKCMQLSSIEQQPKQHFALTPMQMQQRINSLGWEIKEISQEVKSWQYRQHNYDNYQIQELQTRLTALEDKTTRKNFRSSETLASLGNKSRASQRRGWESGDSASQVDQSQEYHSNIDRLIGVLHHLGGTLPLPIEIDQTGFARSTRTGMYLLDHQGKGFRFSPQELALLAKRRVVNVQAYQRLE